MAVLPRETALPGRALGMTTPVEERRFTSEHLEDFVAEASERGSKSRSTKTVLREPFFPPTRVRSGPTCGARRLARLYQVVADDRRFEGEHPPGEAQPSRQGALQGLSVASKVL